jgi:hypothetical protein
MTLKSLTRFCFETLAGEIKLERVAGLDDIERVKLLTGEDGGGIRLYKGDKIDKVSLVDFRYASGVPIPHHDNALAVGAEIFQILPDFSYKLPIWGINSVIFKDGRYTFDTDLSFGFDLVMDYGFTMKYLEPFDALHKKFLTHKDFHMVTMDKTTTWVRTYISPVFVIAETRVEKIDSVFELCAEFIKLWVRMYNEAEQVDDDFKKRQKQRIQCQYDGMRQTDRMGKILLGVYGRETFAKFFRAMA